MAPKAETEMDNDPTGMYAEARRIHEMASRNRATIRRRERIVETSVTLHTTESSSNWPSYSDEPSDGPPFALLDVVPGEVEFADLDGGDGFGEADEPKPRINGWVPTRPVQVEPPPARPAIDAPLASDSERAIEGRQAVSITDLVPPEPTVATRVFPTLESPVDRVRKSWPDQTSPFFEEVDSEVTWPKTPTGRKAKRGPKLKIFGGRSWADYMAMVREDHRRVLFEQRILEVSLDEQYRRG